MKLNAAALRTSPVDPQIASAIKRNPVYLILDNVLDTYNVGALFRLADATACQSVYLCGGTETPPNSKIKKSSVNTWQWVPWEYTASAADAIRSLKSIQPDIQVVAVEQDSRSIRFDTANYRLPTALVLGNESYGVSAEALSMADVIVELPMWGINTSLNVMVSGGIVLYEVMRRIRTD